MKIKTISYCYVHSNNVISILHADNDMAQECVSMDTHTYHVSQSHLTNIDH